MESRKKNSAIREMFQFLTLCEKRVEIGIANLNYSHVFKICIPFAPITCSKHVIACSTIARGISWSIAGIWRVIIDFKWGIVAGFLPRHDLSGIPINRSKMDTNSENENAGSGKSSRISNVGIKQCRHLSGNMRLSILHEDNSL